MREPEDKDGNFTEKSHCWKFSFQNENAEASATTYSVFRKNSVPELFSPLPLFRRSLSFSAMDWKKKISSDHTDIAYLEAVNRLRAILSPRPSSSCETSAKVYDENEPTTSSASSALKRFNIRSESPLLSNRVDRFAVRSSLFNTTREPPSHSFFPFRTPATEQVRTPNDDELLEFLSKQTDYISQLESETKYCRDDLTQMLDKVKDVISENELLHQKQKQSTLRSSVEAEEKAAQLLSTTGTSNNIGDMPKSILKKTINTHADTSMMESKILDLETQVKKLKRSLNSAQEEVVKLKNCRNWAEGDNFHNPYAFCDLHRSEIDNLNGEKQDLLDTLAKFRVLVNEMRDRENDAALKVQNSLEIVTLLENQKLECHKEIKTLQEELDKQRSVIKELKYENSRKIEDEKMSLENKYRKEIEILNESINSEVDSFARTKLELERLKRIEVSLKREVQMKNEALEELRQENLNRMGQVQIDLTQALQARNQAEQNLMNKKLIIEKLIRDAKQHANKLHVENAALKQRITAYESELAKSQEAIAGLHSNIIHLQHTNEVLKNKGGNVGETTTQVLRKLEEKHTQDLTDLEKLIEEQNALVEKLRNECKMLTDKLDEACKVYKKDLVQREHEKEKLMKSNRIAVDNNKDLEKKVQFYESSHQQMVARIAKLEAEERVRADRVFQLLSRQSGLLDENADLHTELMSLRKSFESHGEKSKNVTT